jgi:uncharacterized membrane protein YeaQ/YmgE (transglycosylase-associated protein family)
MWMLSFVPDSLLIWIVNTILIIGAIGSFLSFFVLHKILNKIPALAPYYLLIQVVSAVLLVAGIYFKGGYDVEASWRDKIRAAQEKAAIAEQQAKEANVKLDAEVKKKQKIVKENTIVYRDRIREVEKIIDKECKVASEAIDIHNAAAKNKSLGTAK